ncbi:hypothetical protein [Streptomyces sp. NPDC059828]|uniref:hypothetical protein n=1 Tax=Streptomyces sp. NPDC059828 TaxID=3346965 RepID=UPI00365D81B0
MSLLSRSAGTSAVRTLLVCGMLAASPLALAPTAVAATGGCTTTTVVDSGTAWSYRACRLPDIDQRRAGLPNDGRMYCLPTSTLNAMFWLDQHGYPNLLTGDYDPTSSAAVHYDEVTAKLRRMGALAETDPATGTGRSDAVDAVNDLIEEKGYEDVLEADWESLDDEDAVSRRIVELTRNGRDLLIASVGRYDRDGDRVSGHAVTVVGASGSVAGNHRIAIHDPADDAHLTTQSATVAATYNLGRDNGDGPEVIGYGSGALTARLEGVVVITTAP